MWPSSWTRTPIATSPLYDTATLPPDPPYCAELTTTITLSAGHFEASVVAFPASQTNSLHCSRSAGSRGACW